MPRDGRATRDRILESAVRLVIERGFAATSLDQVIADSGSSKGSFFHHFESKQALAEALVERYVAADLEMLADGLAVAKATVSSAPPALAFLDHYVTIADEIMGGQTGCLYTSILSETQLIEAGTSEPIARAVLSWRERFAGLLRESLDDRAEVDVDALADHVFVTFEGAFLLARSLGDPSHMRRQLAVLRMLVASLLEGPAQVRT
ncbi:MAG: TetR/AcrR family transcriptional regulator [Nocardioides sp.]